jgi:hypothetical protein
LHCFRHPNNPRGHPYLQVSLSVTNFLGSRGDSRPLYTTISSAALPSAIVTSPALVVVTRSQGLLLAGRGAVSPCSNASTAKFSYTW